MPNFLSHYKILDLSRILAGPFATQLLADMGAEVLKIEPPQGDPTRGWGPPFEPGTGESAYFRCANRGKRSIAMDLDDEGCRALMHELMVGADVLVENFAPDSAEALGLTWEAIHDRYPKLIVASVRGYASDVPASRRPGYDFILQAESGLMSLGGEPGGPPMKTGVAIVDVVAGLYLANGIQAAMLHRERTGEALHVEVPLMEAALASLVNVASSTLMTGEAPRRWGNAHPQIVPYQTFPCEGGDVALGCGSDRQFEVLALWAGLDLEAEPHWRLNRGRVEDRERVVAALEAHFRRTPLEAVLTFCETHAIPAGRVRTVDEVLFREAGNLHQLVTTIFDAEDGRMVPMLAAPILFNDLRARSRIAPPRLRE